MLLANGDGTSFWDLFLLLAIFLPLMFLWAFGLVDVFLRKDLSGIAKVVWAILILWLPLIGILVYFLTRPDDPTMMSWSDDGGGSIGPGSDSNVGGDIESTSEKDRPQAGPGGDRG